MSFDESLDSHVKAVSQLNCETLIISFIRGINKHSHYPDPACKAVIKSGWRWRTSQVTAGPGWEVMSLSTHDVIFLLQKDLIVVLLGLLEIEDRRKKVS